MTTLYTSVKKYMLFLQNTIPLSMNFTDLTNYIEKSFIINILLMNIRVYRSWGRFLSILAQVYT